MHHIIIEQTAEYKKRIKYDQVNNNFYETDQTSLGFIRNCSYPYGWVKESGTPPEAHLDIILVSTEKYKLGDEVEVKTVGCFVRKDGDNKLIGILPDRTETEFTQLPEDEKAELRRLYPRVDDGEGWYGAERANEIIKAFQNNLK